MKMITGAALAIVLTTFIAPQLRAQNLGLGPQLGYLKTKDADEGKFMGGAALRLRLTPALGIEGSINYRQEKFNDGILTVRSWPVMVTGLVYPLPLVYGAVGAGWYHTTFDFEPGNGLPFSREDETQTEFGWHFGAGVELPLASATRLTGDIRYVFLDYDFKDIPGTGNLDSNFYVINIGLLFGL